MTWTFNTLEHYHQHYWEQRRHMLTYEFLSQTDQHNNHTSHYIRHGAGWIILPKNMVIA